MKTLKLTSVVLLLAIFVCGCQSDFDNDELTVLSQENKGTRSDIVLEVLMPSVTTRGIYNLDVFEGIEGLEEYKEAYRCSSENSSLIADIYLSEDYKEAVTLILNKELEPAYYLKFKIEGIDDNNVAMFTAFNEFENPIMSGKYSYENCYFEITDVYGNDLVTRASAASWGCNLSLWACGAVWGTAVGMVSMGGGLLVSLAYTAAAVQICDGL